MAAAGRILIADDELGILQSTSELLRREGYECAIACDASAARERLKQKEYDLLIADIRMPGNLEMEFIKEIPQTAKGMPVIMMTAYPSLDTAVLSIELPVVAYLVKPFDVESLLKHVRSAVSYHQTYRAVCDARERLTQWQQDLEAIEGLLNGPSPNSQLASVDTFVALTLSNIVASLSNLRQLIDSLQKGQPDGEVANLLSSSQVETLKDLIRETVSVLEKTRSAFKSRDLGDLRMRLERILNDTAFSKPAVKPQPPPPTQGGIGGAEGIRTPGL